jgi:hypothetical protein
MYTNNTYQAEIEYRRDRIRNEVAGSRRTRVPFVRRTAESRRTSR